MNASNPPDAPEPAMSEQQRRLSSGKAGLALYKDWVVGEAGYPALVAYELYNLLLLDLTGAAGYGLRALALPAFLQSAGANLKIGRGVVIRQPRCVTLGRGIVIDDFAVLDVRQKQSEAAAIELGDYTLLGRSSMIVAKDAVIRLGPAVNVGAFCRIASQSAVSIGESTLIGAYAYIGPGNHAITEIDHPIIEQQMEIRGGVTIGKNCWIGTKATILDGVTIGANAIVGAHSLVREDVPEGAVVAGTPARVLRYR